MSNLLRDFRVWGKAVLTVIGTIADHLSRISWPALALVAMVIFFNDAKAILSKLTTRIDAGSAIKIGLLEFGSLQGIPIVDSNPLPTTTPLVSRPASKEWGQAREDYYGPRERAVGLVHRLYRSPTSGQLYDALIYVIPHKDASLAGISKVEYYLGHFWGDRVFESMDRSRGFPIIVSAYGPFLALAKIFYNDGQTKMVHRYIDFEMGDVAKPIPKEPE